MKPLTAKLMEQACDPGCGAVVSCAVEQGVKNVKKLLKEYAEDIRVIMFHLTEKDMALADGKKLIGFTNSWKTLRCKKVVSLARDSLFQGKESEPAPSETFSSLITSLSGTSATVSRPGMLVFFPGIPGCGKSCMAVAENDIRKKLKETSVDRELHVLVGDKTKTKYWPLVKQTRRRDTSSIVLADKNVPYVSWDLVGGVCAGTKAFGIPVVPDAKALSTTVIDGVQFLDGGTSDRKHVYPFSLAYLAVCLARVLARPTGTHAGKLDSGTKRASMIVIMFYSLYRRLPADEFMESMGFKFTGEGALLSPSPITLSFFKPTAPELPPEVEEALVDALKLQVRIYVFMGRCLFYALFSLMFILLLLPDTYNDSMHVRLPRWTPPKKTTQNLTKWKADFGTSSRNTASFCLV